MTFKIPKSHIDEIIEQSAFEDFKTKNGNCTIVAMTLPNGYTLVESSGCIDPDEYDHELGISLCKEALRRKVWQMEGYLGMQKFHEMQY